MRGGVPVPATRLQWETNAWRWRTEDDFWDSSGGGLEAIVGE